MNFTQKLRLFIMKFLTDTRADFDIADVVIDVSIALFICGILLSSALVELAAANWTGVDTSVKTVAVVLLPVLAVLAIAMVMFKAYRKGKG